MAVMTAMLFEKASPPWAACSTAWSWGPCTWKPSLDILVGFLVSDKMVVEAARFGVVGFTRRLVPAGRQGRKEGVAVEGVGDLGDDQAVGSAAGQGLGENLGAADDAGACAGSCAASQRDGRLERAGGVDPIVRPGRIAGDDDVAALGQGPPDRFKGLAAHDDGMAQGDPLVMGEVLRQVPGQLVVDADAALGIHGNNEGEVGAFHLRSFVISAGSGEGRILAARPGTMGGFSA